MTEKIDADLEKYLHCLMKTDEHGNSPGWYFRDETGELHGPFESHDETIENLCVYSDWLRRHG